MKHVSDLSKQNVADGWKVSGSPINSSPQGSERDSYTAPAQGRTRGSYAAPAPGSARGSYAAPAPAPGSARGSYAAPAPGSARGSYAAPAPGSARGSYAAPGNARGSYTQQNIKVTATRSATKLTPLYLEENTNSQKVNVRTVRRACSTKKADRPLSQASFSNEYRDHIKQNTLARSSSCRERVSRRSDADIKTATPSHTLPHTYQVDPLTGCLQPYSVIPSPSPFDRLRRSYHPENTTIQYTIPTCNKIPADSSVSEYGVQQNNYIPVDDVLSVLCKISSVTVKANIHNIELLKVCKRFKFHFYGDTYKTLKRIIQSISTDNGWKVVGAHIIDKCQELNEKLVRQVEKITVHYHHQRFRSEALRIITSHYYPSNFQGKNLQAIEYILNQIASSSFLMPSGKTLYSYGDEIRSSPFYIIRRALHQAVRSQEELDLNFLIFAIILLDNFAYDFSQTLI